MNRSKPRLLVANDDGTILSLLARRRSAGDLHVFTAVGEEVIEVLRATEPDLVLLNVDGRPKESLLAIRLMLAVAPALRIIVVTNPVTDLERQDLMAEGACLCLQKPVDLPSLDRAIDGIV